MLLLWKEDDSITLLFMVFRLEHFVKTILMLHLHEFQRICSSWLITAKILTFSILLVILKCLRYYLIKRIVLTHVKVCKLFLVSFYSVTKISDGWLRRQSWCGRGKVWSFKPCSGWILPHIELIAKWGMNDSSDGKNVVEFVYIHRELYDSLGDSSAKETNSSSIRK